MPESNNQYRIHHYAGNGSVSHLAAKKAQRLVAEYAAKAEALEVQEAKIEIKGGYSKPELLNLIENGKPHWFFVVPMANSVRGDVTDFMPFCQFHNIGKVDVDITFVVCNKSGEAKDIVKIVTKDTAFEQVAEELSERGFDVDHLNGSSNGISTEDGAKIAAADESKAAICLLDVCANLGLKQIGDVFKRLTTFYIFVNESRANARAGGNHPQYMTLIRHVGLYSGDVPGGGKLQFAERIKTADKEKLTVKWGIDPLSRKMHLGHLACLYKLQDFLQFGHKVVIVLGTFTGQIGDPSGNLTARPRYPRDTLDASADILEKQIRIVLADYMGENRNRVAILRNHDLVKDMDMSQLLRWGYDIDQSLLLDRPDFEKRRQGKRPLSLSEVLYGLFQANDTLVTRADLELAGVDQLHNGILMRNVFRLENLPPPFLMLLPLLPGTRGEAKMSSFAKNEVSISMSRNAIRERLLSLTDSRDITQYFRLLTDVDEETIAANRESVEKGKGLVLRDLQQQLAEAVLEKLPVDLENLLDEPEHSLNT